MSADPIQVRMALVCGEITPAEAAAALGWSEEEARAYYQHTVGEPWEPEASVSKRPDPAPYAHVPELMKQARRWLLWRSQANGGDKPRKVPYYASHLKRHGTLDSPEDITQLVSFDEARAALQQRPTLYAGLGFALGPDGTGMHWQGIDLDHLSERSKLLSLANELPGYTETSPSGDGRHAIGYGRSFETLGSNASGIEAYSRSRFFTVTGDAISGEVTELSDFVEQTLTPIHQRQSPEAPRANSAHAPEFKHHPTGSRNVALTSVAGKLRKAGLDEDAIFAALQAYNTTHCKPPLSEAEVLSIARSVSKYSPGSGTLASVTIEWPRVTVPDERPPAREHFLHPLIPRGEVTLLYGAGGKGKSYLALELAVHLAAGLPWAGLPANSPVRVLYVSMEDDAQTLAFRVHHILHDYEQLAAGEREFQPGRVVRPLASLEGVCERLILLDASDGPPLVQETSEQGVRKLAPTAAIDTLRDSVARYQPDVVVIDNASDAFAGDENSRVQVRAFLHRLKQTMRDADCPDAAVLLLAHVNKGGTYSGSTAWNNTSRSRLMLEETESGIWLRQEKVNHAMRAEPIALVRREGLLLPATGTEGRRDLEADKRAVLNAVRAAQRHGLAVPASPRTPHHCSAQAVLSGFAELDALPAALACKEGRDRFWRAVRALIVDGELVERESKTPGRKSRVCLMCGAEQ